MSLARRSLSLALRLAFAVALRAEAGTPPSASYNAFAVQPKLPAARGARPATKLVYVFGDDSVIDSGAEKTVKALVDRPHATTLHSLIFNDRQALGPSLTLLDEDGRNGGRSSPIAPNTWTVQSNNPLFMAKVLRWTFDNYPGERRYLEIDGHGGGPLGVGSDGNQTDAAGGKLPRQFQLMPVQAFAKGLRDGTGGKPIDVVLFNACLMSNVEALWEIEPSVRYAVGSQRPISAWSATVLYDLPLAFERLASLGKPPELIARALAQQALPKRVKKASLVESGTADDKSSGIRSVAAVDLAKLSGVVQAFASFSAALIAALPAHEQQIVDAYDATARDSRAAADLWSLTHEMMTRVKDPAVAAAARAVRSAQERAMLFEKDQLGGENGLSVLLPERKQTLDAPAILRHGYPQTRFARATRWHEFLREIARRKALTASPRKPKARPAQMAAHAAAHL